MKMLPAKSTTTHVGWYTAVAVAIMPFSKGEISPLPATVVITPVLTVIFRMRLFPVSAMKMSPFLSTATSSGLNSGALVASIPSFS